MIDFCRLAACPRCRRGIDPDVTAEDAADCPVCRGRPVRALLIWNDVADRVRDADLESMGLRHRVTGEAALLAADLVGRPDAACGEVVRARF